MFVSICVVLPASRFSTIRQRPPRQYGVPTDIKIKKTPLRSGNDGAAVYLASFTALTPAMRER